MLCRCPACATEPARVSLDQPVTLLDGSAPLSTVAPFITLQRGGRAVTLSGSAWATLLRAAIARGFKPAPTRRTAAHTVTDPRFGQESVRLSDGRGFHIRDDAWPSGYAGGPHEISVLDLAALQRSLKGVPTVDARRVRDLLARPSGEPLRLS